jgi:hypothetical protein
MIPKLVTVNPTARIATNDLENNQLQMASLEQSDSLKSGWQLA